jgi:uncharacterized protein (DUF488 family)
MKVFSIGHSNRSLEEFVRLLQGAGVDHLVDVRRFPHSSRHPHFNIEMLPDSLAKAGIHYSHMAELGGRRPARADGKPSENTLWREKSFQNYADYAETPVFRAAFEKLLEFARTGRPAIMCAEALWWQCHRRIITDYLLAAGVEVDHIIGDKIEPARLTESAIIRPDHTLLYSDPAPALF